jgi:2,4-dienoyl-CoA reductase-like NADH-dependent reductase (Old Yellow Enzyme family)
MNNWKHVFEPIRIRNVTVPNRIVRSAHGTYLSPGLTISDRLIAYHVERAKHGVGLSCIELVSVHPTGYFFSLRSQDDSIIPSYRKLVSAVKPYGMVLFQQVAHSGHIYPGDDGLTYSCSPTPSPIDGKVPIGMSKDMIAEVIDAFAQAARRAEEGGIQGVEVHGGHGYLVQQFMSPIVNRRTDEYGGSLDNRLRFVREVLAAIRKVVSPGFPVGIRFSDDGVPGGLSADETMKIVQLLEADGAIDFINGSHGSYYLQPVMIPTMEYPLAPMLPSASRIASGVSHIPRIITAGRIRTLDEAEQILRDKLADLVVLQRAHIADPAVISKSRAGRVTEVRPCISCNQGCVGGLSRGTHVGCAVNPVVGFEATLSEDLITRVSDPQRVLVVGGGPAGMEAARLAAMCGHAVTLVEASADLGGEIKVAKLSHRLYALNDIAVWLEQEVYRLDVDVRTNHYVDENDILALKPDAVIIATGSQPRMDGVQAAVPAAVIKGVGLPHVVSPADLLTVHAGKPLPRSALVFDEIGGNEALSVAQWLTTRGVAVTYATRFASIAPTVDQWLRIEPALQELHKAEFRLITRAQIVEISNGECAVKPLQGNSVETVAADIVVLSLAREPLAQLYYALKGRIAELHIVGDAKTPRDIQAAIAEGHMAGRFLFQKRPGLWRSG